MARIVMLADAFPAPSERFIEREVKGLRRLGMDLEVVALRGEGREAVLLPDRSRGARLSALGRFIVLSPGQGAFRAALSGGMWRFPSVAADAASVVDICRRLGACHLHACFASRPAAVGLSAARLAGIGFSFSAHARDIFVEGGDLAVKTAGAAFVAVCSDYGRQSLASRLPRELHARLHLVRHGLEFAAATVRRRPDTPLIVAVGRLVAKKGFNHLIRACGLLARQGRDFQCVIAGEGPERAVLQRETVEAGLTERLELPGWLDGESLNGLLGRATLLVVPSVIAPDGDRDGLPNVILEALAAGVPVAASSLAAIPELIEDGTTGLLVEPGDEAGLAEAVGRLLDDPELAARLSAAGKRRVAAEYDLMSNVRRLADLLERAVEEKHVR